MPPTSIIDRSRIEDALTGFKTTFNTAFERSSTITADIATTVDSDSPQETYTWFGETPIMREWIGDRQFEELRAYAMTIVNKDWANGLRVKANDIRDDKLGLIQPRISAMAGEAAYHQEDLLMGLLLAGFAGTKGLAYDGQFFFDTDHSDGGSASQSNKGTAALDATSYAAAWQSMLERKNEKGKSIRIMPKTLIVGPKLRAAAIALLEGEVLASGASNTNFGTAKLIVHPLLTGTQDDWWFLIGEGAGGQKPLILQQRKAVEFIAQDELTSEGYFNRKEFRYGADWSGNVGFGPWQLAYGAIVA